jgi:hypothetical protein
MLDSAIDETMGRKTEDGAMKKGMSKAAAVDHVTFRPVFGTDEHVKVIVTTKRGYAYFTIYAVEPGTYPNVDKVIGDWNDDGGSRSKNWAPYFA